MYLLAQIIDLYSLIVLVAVVMSWMRPNPRSQFVMFVRFLTDPVLEPIRRALPPMGGLDLSPLILLFGLQLLKGLLY